MTTINPMDSIYNKKMTRYPDKPRRQMVGTTISGQEACVASVFVWDKEKGSIGVSEGHKNRRTPKTDVGYSLQNYCVPICKQLLELGGFWCKSAAGGCNGSHDCMLPARARFLSTPSSFTCTTPINCSVLSLDVSLCLMY